MGEFSDRFEIIYQKYATWGEKNGFKPSKLAFSRFLGVFQTSMQRWEKGKIPNPKELKTIHEKLGFSYDWLISGEGEMFDETAAILAEKDAEIARLRTMLLVDGVGDKAVVTAIARVAGQE